MTQNELLEEGTQIAFQELIKRAYERGTSDAEITVGKLLDDIIFDLKNIMANSGR
jgi:hypothetical protein